MKIIVFTYNIPRPDRSSGERRFVALLELLAEDHLVDLCVSRFYGDYLQDEHQRYIPKLVEKGINVLPIRKGIVEEVLQERKYDIGFFEFYWIAEENIFHFWKYQPGAITIVDSVDVHFAREETQAKLGIISEEKVKDTRNRELTIYRNADITLAVSQEDISLLTDKYHIKNVLFVPNIVPTVPRKPGNRKPVALFIGSFLWPPNANAMEWFTKDIWPKIHKQNPEARFHIVGNSPSEEVLALNNINGVEVLGFVPETAPYLENAAVSVAPLLFGGGMKGKVNEALSYGLPVVATTIGGQGFHAENGTEMIITDDPDQIVEEILSLFADPQKQERIGIAGQQLNARLCSPEVVKDLLKLMANKAEEIRSSGARPSTSYRIFSWKMRAKVRKLKEIIQYYKSRPGKK